MATRTIADAITDDIPELYVLGNPPASVVAFGSKNPSVDALEVGDAMSRRGWHLIGLSDPKSVHIACTVRFLVSMFGWLNANPFLSFFYPSISMIHVSFLSFHMLVKRINTRSGLHFPSWTHLSMI